MAALTSIRNIGPAFATSLTAVGITTAEELRELGADVVSIFAEPNGLNINDHCGATHTDTLRKAVIQHDADVGVALDGDGDRLIMVDEKGMEVDGDELVFIIARHALKKGELKGGVVGTLMSNLGLEIALKNLSIPFKRAKVGDRYVMQLLKENSCLLVVNLQVT